MRMVGNVTVAFLSLTDPFTRLFYRSFHRYSQIMRSIVYWHLLLFPSAPTSRTVCTVHSLWLSKPRDSPPLGMDTSEYVICFYHHPFPLLCNWLKIFLCCFPQNLMHLLFQMFSGFPINFFFFFFCEHNKKSMGLYGSYKGNALQIFTKWCTCFSVLDLFSFLLPIQVGMAVDAIMMKLDM